MIFMRKGTIVHLFTVMYFVLSAWDMADSIYWLNEYN